MTESLANADLLACVAAIAELDEKLVRLERSVTDVESRLPATPAPPSDAGELPPLEWSRLPPRELEAAWTGLAGWLDEQVAAHRVQGLLPKRWWRDEGLVAHLAAYWHWHAEVVSMRPSGQAAAVWHESFLRFAETVWPGYVSRAATAGSQAADSPALRQWIDDQLRARREP